MTTTELTTAAADYVTFARCGDPEALERVLHACADQAYTQAYRRLGNAADADDAVQEAFLQLVRCASRFDGSMSFHIWLALLVKTACLRLLRSDRRRKRREGNAMSGVESTRDLDISCADSAEELRTMISRLSAADSTAIELHYFAGLSQAEVAVAVGTSENAIALRLSRARNRLRKMLGGQMTSVALIALLGSQSAYAAPPQAIAGITSLSAAVAAGSALPTTTITLSLAQKALLFMSLHPLSTAACVALFLVGGLAPAFLITAENHPPVVNPVVVSSTPHVDLAWQGKAKELLPFIDPQAPAQFAVDWQHLRQLAPKTKLTSLLSDPRAQPALAHIRKQFQLGTNGSGEPNWVEWLAHADGAVLSGKDSPANLGMDLVLELGEPRAKELMDWLMNNKSVPGSPITIGPFRGVGNDEQIFGTAGGRYAHASAEFLKSGLARLPAPAPTAPLHIFHDGSKAIATLTKLAAQHGDLLNIEGLVGKDWRNAKPTLSVDGDAADGVWRLRALCRGIAALPLRPVAPSIAGCVTPGALASCILGCEPKPMVALVERFIGENQTQSMLKRMGLSDKVLDCLSGDLAMVVRPGAPIPEFTVVLGLRADTSKILSREISGVLKKMEFNADGGGDAPTTWNGFTPIGALNVSIAVDRLVLSTGSVKDSLVSAPRTVSEALAIDIDVPALSQTYLPILMAMAPAPAQAKYIPFEDLPMRKLFRSIDGVRLMHRYKKSPTFNLDHLDNNSSGHRESLQTAWNQLVDRTDLPMQPHIAVFINTTLEEKLHAECTVVFRRLNGWRVIMPNTFGNIMTIEDFSDMATLERRLKGLRHVGGVLPVDLAVVDIPDQPCFDRRWLPPLAAVVDHMPTYRFRLQATGDGFSAVEDGLPMLLLSGAVAISELSCSSEEKPQLDNSFVHYWILKRRYLDAMLRKYGPALELRHQRAIEALRKVNVALASRRPTDPLLVTPSSAFAAAGIPLVELASLNNGVTPTPTQVDQLGFWHPKDWPGNHYEWLIPLENGVFIESAWWAGPTSVQLSTRPGINQRPSTAEDINNMLKEIKRNQQREGMNDKGEPLPQKKAPNTPKAPVDPQPPADNANEF